MKRLLSILLLLPLTLLAQMDAPILTGNGGSGSGGSGGGSLWEYSAGFLQPKLDTPFLVMPSGSDNQGTLVITSKEFGAQTVDSTNNVTHELNLNSDQDEAYWLRDSSGTDSDCQILFNEAGIRMDANRYIRMFTQGVTIGTQTPLAKLTVYDEAGGFLAHFKADTSATAGRIILENATSQILGFYRDDTFEVGRIWSNSDDTFRIESPEGFPIKIGGNSLVVGHGIQGTGDKVYLKASTTFTSEEGESHLDLDTSRFELGRQTTDYYDRVYAGAGNGIYLRSRDEISTDQVAIQVAGQQDVIRYTYSIGGFAFNYDFPADTGAVGQVLSVATNNHGGITTLEWTTPPGGIWVERNDSAIAYGTSTTADSLYLIRTPNLEGGVGAFLFASSADITNYIGFMDDGTIDFGGNEVEIQSLLINNAPAYDDDADAGGAGLTTGQVYQTTGLGAAPLNVAGIIMVKQ